MAASHDIPILVFPPDSSDDEPEAEVIVEDPAPERPVVREPEPEVIVEDRPPQRPVVREPAPRRRPKPRQFELLFDMVFLVFAVVIVFIAPDLVLRDEAGLHLASGERILEQWRPTAEAETLAAAPASDGDIPAVWLSQAVMGQAHKMGGLAAVVILAGLLLAFSYGLLAAFLQGRGIHPLVAAGTVLAAAVLGAAHWATAPAIFMYLAVVLLFVLLHGSSYRNLIGLGVLFAFWASLGGSWFGLLVVALVAAGDLVELWWGDGAPAWGERARYHGVAFGVALAATLANPLGRLVAAQDAAPLREALASLGAQQAAYGLSALQTAVFIAVVVVVMGALALRPRSLPWPTLLVLLATLGLALAAPGHAALFALLGLPLCLLPFTATPTVAAAPFPRPRTRRHRPPADDELPQGWIAGAVALLLLLIAYASGTVADFQIVRDDFDPNRFPVAALETARSVDAFGTLCGDPEWDGYIAYAWPPRATGSTDEPDPDAGTAAAPRCADLDLRIPGWRESLASTRPDVLAVPTEGPLAGEIAHAGDWRVWYRDPVAVLLVPAELDDIPVHPSAPEAEDVPTES